MIRAWTTTASGPVSLKHNEEILLQLNLPDAGKYVIFAKLTIQNVDGDWQNAGARLTTMNGVTTLDRAGVRIGARGDYQNLGSQSLALQAKLDLPSTDETPEVQLRAETYLGTASDMSLFAITVDEFG
jgi:hypothetical protein